MKSLTTTFLFYLKPYSVLIFFISNLGFSQTDTDLTVYLDSLNRETTKNHHVYYKIIKDYSLDKTEYKNFIYYKSGKLKEEYGLNGKDGGSRIGQNTSYYENGNKQNVTFYDDGRPTGKYAKWFENGNKKEDGEYIDAKDRFVGSYYKLINFWDDKNNQTVVDGNGTYNSEDKFHTESGVYKNGYKDGVWKGRYQKDKSSYSEIYEEGKFVSGEISDGNGNKEEYLSLETQPKPKKGIQDFYEYIGRNFSFTRRALNNDVKGKIVVGFIVEKNGQIVEIKVVKGLGYGLDEEAIRVVSRYENWLPGKQRGRAVRVSYLLPIRVEPPR
jgi:antitoxin component YwqK of YwqJK toxin-antitoxin module